MHFIALKYGRLHQYRHIGFHYRGDGYISDKGERNLITFGNVQLECARKIRGCPCLSGHNIDTH